MVPLRGFVCQWQSDSAGNRSKFVLISGVIGAALCSFSETFTNGLSLTWLYCCILARGCVVFLWHVSATCASCAMISYIACGHNISSVNCLFYVLGSEASRESVKAGECHSGGEGERHFADSAFAGLRQHCKRSEQC